MTIVFLFLYAFMFAFIAFVQKKVFDSIRTPLTFFSLLWCVVGFVANLGLYEYYLPSEFVNTVIIVGIITFTIAYLALFSRFPRSFFYSEINVENDYFNVNYQLILIINIICLLFEMPILLRSVATISRLGMAYVRAYSSEVYGNILFAQISETLVKPTFTATTLLAVILSMCSKGVKKKGVILLAIIDNVVLVIVTAGRSPFVNAIFYLLIGMLLMKGENIRRILHKDKKRILYLIAAVFAVVFVSSLRAGNRVTSSDLLGSFYSYYFSGPSYLSRLLESYNEYGIGGKYLWGAATFGFIVNYFIILLDPLFGGNLETTINILGSKITSRQMVVGATTRLNSMCTVFYPFLVDWGYIGIIIGPIVLAAISKILSKNLYRKNSITNTGLYIYWIYTLIRTVFKWDMVSTDFLMIAFMLHMFTAQNKRRV